MKTLVLLLVLSGGVVSGAESVFRSPPQVEPDRGEAKISFTLARPTDVEVAVLDAKGKVVRHLAAGVLGGKNPPPPLRPALAQTLRWDGRDDFGRVAEGGPFRVRVRAAARAELGKIIGDPAALHGKVYGLATDQDGSLFVAVGGVYSSAPVFAIKVFDSQGKYLRTILPMPADLPPERAAEFGAGRSPDGHLKPQNYDALVPYVQRGGIVAFLGNRVMDGQLWLLSTEGRICRLDAKDGAPIAWESGPKTIAPSGGPMCWAVSRDGKSLYMSGWWNWREKDGSRGDGVIRRVDPATGTATEWLRVDVPADSPWLTEPNGWYMFKNWGRKNGQAGLHGLAIDRQGRLYVCDRINQRLAVYDENAKLLGATPVNWPDHVAPADDGRTVYVLTREVIDGYKAINRFRVLKLSAAIDGQVLAELSLGGTNAPQMAVSSAGSPPVIWLSNVGESGEKLVRIEDRGTELVVTDEKVCEMDTGIVKLWVDPFSDDVYVNNGWNRLAKYDGLSGARQELPIKAIDLAFGPDRRLYLMGRGGWKEPIYRCTRDFQPVPFSSTGEPTAGKEIYGRYGMGWSNKGIAVGLDGRFYVRHMYEWCKYHLLVFGPDGALERHGRVADAIIGPLDGQSGGVRVDCRGNLYVGTAGHPAETTPARKYEGCVIKVGPGGGGLVDEKGSREGIPLESQFFEGALEAYPHLAPRQSNGCVCKEARFDVDPFGRVYVPNVLDFCIRVYDNQGNLITRFGRYGNADSAGAGSRVPTPPIPLGWPMTCGVNRADRVYVSDVLNHRIVRVDLDFDVEVEVPVQ